MNDIDINKKFAGNILFDYVWWILLEAKRKDIKTLYFLARDGFLLCKIAQLFIEKFALDIKCKYLYCSRFSLRTASYFLLDNEKYELLLFPSNTMTPKTILDRGNLTVEQYKIVNENLGINETNQNQILTRKGFVDFKNKLLNYEEFWNYVDSNSRQAYKNLVNYLKQEKVFEQKTFAIVDSGWSGSMQRSLRQILCNENYEGNIIGFYFGMYKAPQDTKDGVFKTFFFNYKGDAYKKAIFSNNLFECILSAPHGMTIGYKFNDNLIEPVFANYNLQNESFISELHASVLDYAKSKLNDIIFFDFNLNKCKRKILHLIKDFMFKPKKNVVEKYGNFIFSDDISEGFSKEIACKKYKFSIRQYSILIRMFSKLLKRDEYVENIFWPYGVIAQYPVLQRNWYRLNFFILQYIKYKSGRF